MPNVFIDNAFNMNDFKQFEVQPLIEDLMSHPTLTLVYAQSGGLKSMLALDMARSVATADTFLGYQVPESKKVLYVDGELSKHTINDRVTLFNLHHIEDNLKYVADAVIDFSDEYTRNDLIAAIKSEGIEFLVLDSIRTLIQMISENSACEFSIFNSFIKEIRDLGCSVLVIHHSGKQSSYAGSTNIVTVFDYCLHIKSIDNDKDQKQLVVEKCRDDYGFNNLNYQLISLNADFGFFEMNKYASIDIESVIERMIDDIKSGRISRINQCGTFLRANAIPINSSNITTHDIYTNYIDKYYIGDDVKSKTEFKALLNAAKIKSAEFSH